MKVSGKGWAGRTWKERERGGERGRRRRANEGEKERKMKSGETGVSETGWTTERLRERGQGKKKASCLGRLLARSFFLEQRRLRMGLLVLIILHAVISFERKKKKKKIAVEKSPEPRRNREESQWILLELEIIRNILQFVRKLKNDVTILWRCSCQFELEVI